jgi:pimeloyl-ACP methyl ester carboxylesterase
MKLSKLIRMAVVSYFALLVFLYYYQDSILYHPTEFPEALPGNISIEKMPIDEGNLNIMVLNRGAKKAIIYFGGNGENVYANGYLFSDAYPDRTQYLMNYRGFSGSAGKPSEEKLRKDAEQLYQRVAKDHGDIIVIGRSLGSGLAIQLASTHPVSKLVLITPYDSILNVATNRMFWLPVKYMLHDKYLSTNYAPLVKASTLILAAENDTLILPERTVELIKYFQPGIVQSVVIKDTGHNNISISPEFLAQLKK